MDDNIEASLLTADCVIIDEVQRISPTVLRNLIEMKQVDNCKLILTGDPIQFLHSSEGGEKSFEVLEELIPKQNQYTLTKKIRTNQEVASFIKKLFKLNLDVGSASIKPQNVYIEYFDNYTDAQYYASQLKKNDWEVINLTTSLYNTEYYYRFNSIKSANSHNVIGQEFDNVATFIGPNFYYDKNVLKSNGTYYNGVKMLFENVTRARKRICLIVINNSAVLDKLLDLM